MVLQRCREWNFHRIPKLVLRVGRLTSASLRITETEYIWTLWNVPQEKRGITADYPNTFLTARGRFSTLATDLCACQVPTCQQTRISLGGRVPQAWCRNLSL